MNLAFKKHAGTRVCQTKEDPCLFNIELEKTNVAAANPKIVLCFYAKTDILH